MCPLFPDPIRSHISPVPSERQSVHQHSETEHRGLHGGRHGGHDRLLSGVFYVVVCFESFLLFIFVFA